MFKKVSILFVLLICFSLIACDNGYIRPDSGNNPPDTGKTETTDKYDDSKSMALVVKAVEKSVEKNIKLSLTLGTSLETQTVNYPFRNIKVINPLKFTVQNPNNADKLTQLCGEGDYRIVIAEIHIEFIYSDENNILHSSWHIDDSIIIIYGSNGKTHCLTNGASYKYQGSKIESIEFDFSNHKKIVGHEIVKDGDSLQSYLVEVNYLKQSATFKSDSQFSVLPETFKEFKTEDVYSINDLI